MFSIVFQSAMDKAKWLFRLIVISAIIYKHGSNCSLEATVSRPLDISECPRSCSCKSVKETTMLVCSIKENGKTGMNSNIQRILDPFVHNITCLKISNESKMNSFPRTICRMRLLEELDLSHNAITQLPKGCFVRMERLRKLNLQNNKISELQKGIFEGLPLLEELSLSYQRNLFHRRWRVFKPVRFGQFERFESGKQSAHNFEFLDFCESSSTSGRQYSTRFQQNKQLYQHFELEFQMWNATCRASSWV